MNLRSVDLNLLVVLDALLAECNVSRAGRRIGLSQPATSAALGRLRQIFGDPLLVRAGRGLVRTRVADDLVIPLRETLGQVERLIVERPEFDPGTADRSFTISASDYATLVLLAPFVRALAAEAPGITVDLLPRFRDVNELLTSDRADIVIEPRELIGTSRFPSRPLYSDRWLCAVDPGNPLVDGDRLSLSQYLRLPHITYGIGLDRQPSLADQHLAGLGLKRRIEVTLESFLLVPFFLHGTGMVSVMLERAVRALSDHAPVRTLEPPVALPDIHEDMFWHPRHTHDPGHRWLRRRLQAAADAL
ncbi:LysR family transcriptional regulator [Marinibaculum pumilum]|uniref:LysR family transcriptional regulator n=1 Tax=Marinibaculum pumilum TaxID=1766165 RepID=A0ABV7L2T4_9PROT